ncbi:alpha/beta fold hydrolase [Patulibacter defluvii]|uniref:alpha/beta fold hydrolase n=1 Tax=Patulibacter defluvii TaxID=3095358 RepID=UPI002A766957|nr:alpha/beta fold hydrolase [Patulibacter sp. DM4]
MLDATDPTTGRPGPAPTSERGWAIRRRLRRSGAPPLRAADLEAAGHAVRERQVELPQGAIRVREVGSGPTLLFVHGLLVDGRLWNAVAAQLADRFHCVLPDLPLGAHRTPLRSDADRTPEGLARLLTALVETLGLEDVTVVANDSGGAVTQLWMDQGGPIARVVLTPCDMFDRFLPPGFSLYQPLARIPGGLGLVALSSRLRAVRRLPIALGALTHREIDDALGRSWLAPVQGDRAIRDDVAAFVRGISSRRLTAAAERLTAFDRPVLLLWAPEQRWFPLAYAERLRAILPDARLRLIHDSGVFSPLEQPRAVADAIAAFAARDAEADQ